MWRITSLKGLRPPLKNLKVFLRCIIPRNKVSGGASDPPDPRRGYGGYGVLVFFRRSLLALKKQVVFSARLRLPWSCQGVSPGKTRGVLTPLGRRIRDLGENSTRVLRFELRIWRLKLPILPLNYTLSELLPPSYHYFGLFIRLHPPAPLSLLF